MNAVWNSEVVGRHASVILCDKRCLRKVCDLLVCRVFVALCYVMLSVHKYGTMDQIAKHDWMFIIHTIWSPAWEDESPLESRGIDRMTKCGKMPSNWSVRETAAKRRDTLVVGGGTAGRPWRWKGPKSNLQRKMKKNYWTASLSLSPCLTHYFCYM